MKRSIRGVQGLVLALLVTLSISGVVVASPAQPRGVQPAMRTVNTYDVNGHLLKTEHVPLSETGTINTYDVNGHLLKSERVPLSEIEQRAISRMPHK